MFEEENIGSDELGDAEELGLASLCLKSNFASFLADEYGSRAALEASTCNEGLKRVGLHCATSKL
jgi:hypothetical protein